MQSVKHEIQIISIALPHTRTEWLHHAVCHSIADIQCNAQWLIKFVNCWAIHIKLHLIKIVNFIKITVTLELTDLKLFWLSWAACRRAWDKRWKQTKLFVQIGGLWGSVLIFAVSHRLVYVCTSVSRFWYTYSYVLCTTNWAINQTKWHEHKVSFEIQKIIVKQTERTIWNGSSLMEAIQSTSLAWWAFMSCDNSSTADHTPNVYESGKQSLLHVHEATELSFISPIHAPSLIYYHSAWAPKLLF